MDTIISRKSNKKKKLAIIGILILISAFIVYASFTKKRSYTVKKSTISIKTVKEDFFEDFIVFQALTEPLNSMFVNIVEGGAIQEIIVENGDFVKQGQPLARLYNPNAELNYMQQETAIIEQINNLNKAKLDLRNQELSLTKDLINIEHDFQNAKSQFELDQKLFEKEILAKNEWEKTQENFRYQKERMKIIKESIAKEKQTNAIQIKQLNQSIGIMEKSLVVLRVNKKNFLVLAPASGRLSSFEPVLGQSYTQGQTLGKIDMMKGYKLIAEVDEFYLNKIKKNQIGTIHFNEKKVQVVVDKVIPEVEKGRFKVELQFGKIEDHDLRQGLSFGVQLILSEKEKIVVLPKGNYYNETSGKWIFVLTNDNTAKRVKIELGRENPIYYEVIKGLRPGDKVVTSGYQDYKNIEVLNLK